MEVWVQLAVFLYRLGHYGNAALVSSIVDWAGIADGSVINFSNHVAWALLGLHDKYVTWPTAAQIESARSMAVTRSGCEAWSGGYLAVDGMAIKLYQKPVLFGESWFNKSSDYAIALQIVILLDSLEIIDYAVGHMGSTHDALAFKDTRIYNQHQALLPRGHYLLADPVYAVTGWCIAPFK
ncbi:hypothetical protein OBBRIDRAFT_879603 [Obba rivulosa]|uniref:DDE Tnp4 domain-containing protein n=1 Tax=Obba rivulosa TaxID=1052685 RepID=A0A8E2B276_9APHY|nr:hypothetical protein OBBRIDRAFT_879603 [Obba rivulosa]